MFNSDIEKRIVEFIKKSPIGVTSSELARYLDINRMTLAKYLEIIKEKALIDFKQLGMAKLWYIPVNINKDVFFQTILTEIVANIDKGQPKEVINDVSLRTAKHIEELYKEFYNIPKLNKDQIAEAIVDAEKKIGGEFSILEKDNNKIILKVDNCPFGKKIKNAPLLCSFTSNIAGIMAAKNSGYGKVHLRRTIAKGDPHCYIIVHLRKTKESEKEIATELHKT